MSTLRRLLAPVAALLAVLVLIQTTDLVRCADEADVAEHSDVAGHANEARADALCGGGCPVPAPGASHHGGGHEHGDEGHAFADCLCHVVFTPTTAVPAVGARPAAWPAAFAYVASAPLEVEPSGLDHVPLG